MIQFLNLIKPYVVFTLYSDCKQNDSTLRSFISGPYQTRLIETVGTCCSLGILGTWISSSVPSFRSGATCAPVLFPLLRNKDQYSFSPPSSSLSRYPQPSSPTVLPLTLQPSNQSHRFYASLQCIFPIRYQVTS